MEGQTNNSLGDELLLENESIEDAEVSELENSEEQTEETIDNDTSQEEAPKEQEPEKFLVEWDGKKVAFEELPQELKQQLWQDHIQKENWQRSHTQKSQELAETKKQLEAQMNEINAVKQQYESMIKEYNAYRSWLIAHPDVAQELMNKMAQDPTYAPLPQQQNTIPPEIQEALKKVEDIENKFLAQEQTEIFNNVVSKYKEYGITPQEVDAYMDQYRDNELGYEEMDELFTKAALWDKLSDKLLKNAKEQGMLEATKKKQATISSARTPTTRDQKPQRRKFSSLEEAITRGVEELF